MARLVTTAEEGTVYLIHLHENEVALMVVGALWGFVVDLRYLVGEKGRKQLRCEAVSPIGQVDLRGGLQRCHPPPR